MDAIAYVLTVLTLTGRSLVAEKPCILAPTPSNGLLAVYESTVDNSLNSIIPVRSGEEFGTVVNFVARAFGGYHKTLGNERGCSKVIGVVGDLDSKTASIIHTLASRANLSTTVVSAVAPSTFLPTTNLALPNLLHMNPLTHYVEALAVFLDHLNWTRIGMISDDTHYYEFAAELIQQKLLENPEREITPAVRISERDNRTRMLQTFKKHGTDVVVISTSDDTACSLMEEVKRLGLTWPTCAWILMDVNFPPPLLAKSCLQVPEVITLKEKTVSEGARNCTFEGSVCFDSRVFHDSIFTVSTPASTISSNIWNGSLSGRIGGQMKFREGKRLANISIVQNVRSGSGSRVEIAFYVTELQHLSVADFFLSGDKPRGKTLLQSYSNYYRTLRLAVINVIFVLLLVFITAIFILYIYFRKEPEIKATSVTVSLSMFLGSYILIAFLPLLVIDTTTSIHCHLLVWLSLAGIPFALITATLLVKVLRVYFIQAHPFSLKHKLFADPVLFLYIMLLVSPSVLILTVWSSYDPHSLNKVIAPKESFTFVHYRCLSKHTIKWIGALLVYNNTLLIAVICLIIRTTKIRYKHFRDTNATNAFAYLSSLIGTLTLIYWYFFHLQELKVSTLNTTTGVLYAGHASIAVLCQLLLFVPKVYSPLKRRLTGRVKELNCPVTVVAGSRPVGIPAQ